MRHPTFGMQQDAKAKQKYRNSVNQTTAADYCCVDNMYWICLNFSLSHTHTHAELFNSAARSADKLFRQKPTSHQQIALQTGQYEDSSFFKLPD